MTRQLGILPTRALFFLDRLERIAVRPILDLEACDPDLVAQPIRLGPVLGFSCGQTRIGERFKQLNPKLNGYDHNYILGAEKTMKMAARLTEPSGR